MPSQIFSSAVDRRLRLREPKSSTESISESSSRQGHAFGLPLFLQAKLAISQPDDPYEQEADRVAEQVMRMPEQGSDSNQHSTIAQRSFAQLPLLVQRQESEPSPEEKPTEPPRFVLHDFDVRLDWFQMTRPIYARDAGNLLQLDERMYWSIGNVWTKNYDFFSGFGLSDTRAADAANFFTPFAIDFALKRDYETFSERFEREADITSYSISPTVLQFDIHDIPGTLRSPLLKIIGVEQSNPYSRKPTR